jgi:hypothetical protein
VTRLSVEKKSEMKSARYLLHHFQTGQTMDFFKTGSSLAATNGSHRECSLELKNIVFITNFLSKIRSFFKGFKNCS